MLKVGLTGGIGSGKTTVAHFFEIINIDVYYADDRAKYLLENDPKIIWQIKENFGKIYNSKSLDKKKLAEIIFKNPKKIKIINGIVHPAVKEDFERWCEQFKHKKYILQEAAILFESGFDKFMDLTISVSADKEKRIERVINRDDVTREKIIDRMKHQLTDDERNKLANFVIKNDDKHLIIPQILDIHKKISNYSS